MENETVVESAKEDSRLDRVRKLLAKAELTDSAAEAEALNERAAELIAKYGIDRAMLAADGKQGDQVVDRVIIASKPFSDKMTTLLWNVAYPLRATGRNIRRWNPDLKGGRKKGGFEYGMRLFAYESDMARIEMLYTSLRNQALAGAAKIRDTSSTYGQTQKAERESYLDGFTAAVYTRLQRAEREAEETREAEQRELQDKAMLEGVKAGPGVALVLADRRTAVARAMDLANGITAADRARWAEDEKRSQERRKAERAECPRCKAGRPCRAHGTAFGRIRSNERVGTRWSDGYADGQRAHLGGGNAVGTGQSELES